MKFVVLIFLLIIHEANFVDERIDENVFDSTLINNFKAQWEFMTSLEKQSVLSKTGKLALYMRLYRSCIITPTGKKGFIDRFPEPRVKVNRDVFYICGKHLKTCIDSVYNSVQQRAGFLFPKRNQQMNDFVIDQEQFRNLVSDSMFAFDVSVSYLLCFFTKNRLDFLRKLPFCSYGIEDDQKKVWPSDKFRDHLNNPLYPTKDDTGYLYEPIDFLDKTDFKCADESFCPDPCCSRTRNRNEFCVHEICKEKDYRRQPLSGMANVTSTIFEGIQHSCKIENVFNDDFIGLSKNQWNISCQCSKPGFLFRFDTQRCVDIDECKFGDVCKNVDEECVNTIGSYQCECKPGFVKIKNKCKALNFLGSPTKWFGAAHTLKTNGIKSSFLLNLFFFQIFMYFCLYIFLM